jgi:uncharacterized membrane protein YphA (DoxX/SURF4 family)
MADGRVPDQTERMRADPLSPGRLNPGLGLYAVGTMLLGVVGLVSGDFATNWQHVGPGVAHRTVLAYATAGSELLAGAALLWPRSARTAAGTLAAFYSIFVLLWLPAALATPRVYDSWANIFEELSLVVAGAAAFAWLSPPESAWARRAGWIARAYGICAISFGADHLIYLKGAAGFVPKWIPPGGVFWVVTTAICFLLAAAAILSGILAGLASRLLGIMITLFWLLIWVPLLIASPRTHFLWSANGMALVLGGGAWLVADVIAAKRRAIISQ